ncbi:MAG: metallophosphoesterase family protein [Pseudomonadales bacterium]|nr:metallophosphoesterase family protein [Pseudomonadales bacterium]
MKKIISTAILFALLPLMAQAQQTLAPDHAAPQAYPAELIHAPTPLPDRVVLTWSGDTATTQSVTWRTDTSVTSAFAEIAVANANGRALAPQRFPAETTTFNSDLNQANYHTLTFVDLQPDTLYAYRVGDGVNWSEYYHFRTASDRAAPFSFIYFGDAQNEIKTHWSRVFREAFSTAPRAAFTLHAGDLINEDAFDAEWGEWHDAPAWVNGTIAVIAAAGNHEYYQNETGRENVSDHWRPQFAFPLQDAPQGLEETVYYIDYQGARIIVLDSNKEQQAQVAWLRQVLSDNPNRWTILTFHHPIFSPARDRDNPELRELWKPVFDEFKVDLVLTGHDHTYARTGQMDIPVGTRNFPAGYQQAYDPAIGTVYVVSVSGPKMYEFGKDVFAKRVAEDTQLFQVIEVYDSELKFRAYTATGELYDAFTLEKQAGQPNRLREMLPPETRKTVE